MSAATLGEVLEPALAGRYAVAGLVVLGWEDACAFVEAAEALRLPVILQAGPGCRRHTPLAVLGAMFRHLADNADVPVVCHLDHGRSYEDCRAALDHGFTSVMYDGSHDPLAANIETTCRVVEVAHAAGVSVEGEVGVVGYAGGDAGAITSAGEAGRFAAQTGVDALAVSVGNVHLQQTRAAVIDWASLRAIEAATTVPLVLHGGSGIALGERRRLARESRVCKFNIGTEVRMAFGAALRRVLRDDPEVFDRLQILNATRDAVREAAASAMRNLAADSPG